MTTISVDATAEASRITASAGRDVSAVDGDSAAYFVVVTANTSLVAVGPRGRELTCVAALSEDIEGHAVWCVKALRGCQRKAVGKNQVHRTAHFDAAVNGDIAAHHIPCHGVVGSHRSGA